MKGEGQGRRWWTRNKDVLMRERERERENES